MIVQVNVSVIKLFFMLNSEEHKILTAHKYQNNPNIFKLKV